MPGTHGLVALGVGHPSRASGVSTPNPRSVEEHLLAHDVTSGTSSNSRACWTTRLPELRGVEGTLSDIILQERLVTKW